MSTIRPVPLRRRTAPSRMRRAWLRLKRWHLRRKLEAESDNLEDILTGAGGLHAEAFWLARHTSRLRIDALRIQIDDIGLALGESLTREKA